MTTASRAAARSRGGRRREARAGLLGLGRAGGGAVAARARRAVPARRARRRRRAWSRRRSRSRTCGCASRRSTPPCVRRLEAIAGAGRATTARRACCAAAASPTSTCSPSAPGDCEDAPDAVVAPGDHEQVAAVLQACAEAGVAVVPFGGGTSVVGGLEPLRGALRRRWSRSTSGGWTGVLARRRALADRGARARACGCRRPTARCGAHGLTLGHVPQSYEWATVGGCVATRSAGPGLDRARADRRDLVARALRDAGGELATRDAPGERRRARRCASWCRAPRARSA